MQLYPFIYVLSTSPFFVAEQSSCNKDSMVQKPENIYYLALYQESLLNPDIDDYLALYFNSREIPEFIFYSLFNTQIMLLPLLHKKCSCPSHK